MIGVYVRKDLQEFAGYYAEDLEAWKGQSGSALLEVRHCQQPSFALIQRQVGLENLTPPTWETLSPAGFDQQVEWLKPVAAQNRKRVLSLGLTFSPPKSFSVAALAGRIVLPALLKVQDRAVDFALAVASQFFVARARGELIAAPLRAYRFRHFYSRADDPQLHTHVELVWQFGESTHALDAYPIFFHQYPIRCLYHYQLVAGLAAEGGSVIRDPVSPLVWEINGIDQGVVSLFSKRSGMIVDAAMRTDHLSLGLAMRVEAYRSQQLFPKPREPIPLSAARAQWSNDLGGRKIYAKGDEVLVPRSTVPKLWDVFSRSSILTETSFCAQALLGCFGQATDGFAALKHLDQAIRESVKAGDLRRGAGQSLCFVKAFRLEKILLARIQRGRGRGRPCVLLGGKVGLNLRKEATAALRKDLLRVVTSGRTLPPGVSMEFKVAAEAGETQHPLILNLEQWDIRLLVETLRDLPGTDTLVWVAEPVHAGDFACFAELQASPPSVRRLLQKTYTLSLRRGKPRIKVEIHAGQIPGDAELKFPRLEKRLAIGQRAVALVAAEYPEKARREQNIRILKGLLLGLPGDNSGPLLEWDEVIRMKEVDLSEENKGIQFVGVHENPIVKIGSGLVFDGVSELGEQMFRRADGERLALSRDVLSKHLNDFVHLRPYLIRPIQGLQVEATLPFPLTAKAGQHLVQEGEIVEIVDWADDKSLRLSDGRWLPPTCRTLLPAYVRQNFEGFKNPPEVVILEDSKPGELMTRLEECSFAKKIIVLSPSPTRSALKIAVALRQKKIASLTKKLNSFRLGGGVCPIIPGRDVWEKALSGQEPELAGQAFPGKRKKPPVEQEEEKPITPAQAPEPTPSMAIPDRGEKPTKRPTKKPQKFKSDTEQEK